MKWDLVKYLCTLLCVLSLTLFGPMDCSPPGSSVPEISQETILEQVAISSSRGTSYPWVKPTSPVSPELVGGFFTLEPYHFLNNTNPEFFRIPNHKILSCVISMFTFLHLQNDLPNFSTS